MRAFDMEPEAVRRLFDLPGDPATTRVVVAMSGGVDSSVAAALARQAGYDVIGVTLQLYDHGAAIHRKGACCAGQDIHDARRVAAALGIPHYVLDYEARFREAVIQPFAEAYAAGETPIPCVACNRTVKFVDLLATARELGASAMVTGHYIETRTRPDGRRAMHVPADTDRDQSYFLFATTQEQLDLCRFPLGLLTKPEVRAIAESLGLEVAKKPDSQDICFVPAGRYGDIVAKLKPEAAEAGDIVHVDGRVLGRHRGIVHFTIGQRKGLGIAAGEPLFVVRLDANRRQVIVGPREALATTRIWLADVNWLGDGPLAAADGLRLGVKLRSTRPPAPATLFVAADGRAHLDLDMPDTAVAAGQAAVFYAAEGAGQRVLGGAFVARHRQIAEERSMNAVPQALLEGVR